MFHSVALHSFFIRISFLAESLMLILWSLRSESHDSNRLSINSYDIFSRVMILILTKPSDTSNFMIFYTLFNGQEQNSRKVFSFI